MARVGRTATVGRKGQIVIPIEIRRAIGLEPGQRVEVSLQDGMAVLKPIPRDLIRILTGCLKDGPSLTDDLKKEHAEELKRDERRCF